MRSLLHITALSKRLTRNFAGRQSTILTFNFEWVCPAQLNGWTLYTTILDSSAVRAEGTSCQHCKSDHHLVWDCSFRTKQTLESKVLSKPSTSAMSQLKFTKWFHNRLKGCNLYQRKACQQGKDSKRAHVWEACRRDHAMADCKLTSSL